jgi:hypothetical protein
MLAHRNIRFGGRPQCDKPRDPRLTPNSLPVVEELIRYDRTFSPAKRDRFLRCWLQPHQRTGLALIESGSVLGYGVIRACRSGCKIGPLFASTPDGADVLFRALAATAEGAEIFLDCPEPNGAAIALATRYGLTPVFETARMYRGQAPDLRLSQIYGITTFELG